MATRTGRGAAAAAARGRAARVDRRRGARAVGLTPSAVSQQLSQLERETGAALLRPLAPRRRADRGRACARGPGRAGAGRARGGARRPRPARRLDRRAGRGRVGRERGGHLRLRRRHRAARGRTGHRGLGARRRAGARHRHARCAATSTSRSSTSTTTSRSRCRTALSSRALGAEPLLARPRRPGRSGAGSRSPTWPPPTGCCPPRTPPAGRPSGPRAASPASRRGCAGRPTTCCCSPGRWPTGTGWPSCRAARSRRTSHRSTSGRCASRGWSAGWRAVARPARRPRPVVAAVARRPVDGRATALTTPERPRMIGQVRALAGAAACN